MFRRTWTRTGPATNMRGPSVQLRRMRIREPLQFHMFIMFAPDNVISIYIYLYIYIYIRALSLAGLGVHGLSLSGPMNATFWLKWELAKIAFIVSTFPTWGDQVAFDQQWILVWGCARVTQ